MKSPLAVDKETVKKYGITEETDVAPMQKLSYLQTQLAEIKHAMWRSRVDIIHATRLTESENDTLKQRGHQNLATHQNEVQQFTGAIVTVNKLINELRTEYPELAVED